MEAASELMNKYFQSISSEVDRAYSLANKARAKGYDPDLTVSIPLAKNMAERVEGIISVAAPQIKGSGVSTRIAELEKQYGLQDWKVAFTIALEVSQQKLCAFKDEREAMEVGLRVGLSYLTVGVVSSPLEGFIRLELKERLDHKGKFFSLYFGGPIRSAGTTAVCAFVALADYVRKKMGYVEYDPTNEEIKRSSSEIDYFHERVANLQYHPSNEEAEFLTARLPLQIEGDPSEKLEVLNYKDLPRVSTNLLRNGYCLALAEALCLKMSKFWGKFSRWNKDFEMEHWQFAEEFVKLQKEIRAKGQKGASKGSEEKVKPDHGYIKDIVAGRPVFGYPMRHGAFRLRYGRTRTSGFSVDAVHPATMILLDNFIAAGTQLKVERPGKSTTITTCDCIEGPIVKLRDGSVVFVENANIAKNVNREVVEIIYAGDILINYGDFLDRAHILAPPGYCEEWWVRELEKSCGENIPDEVKRFSENFSTSLSCAEAIQISKKYNIPFHPRYSYHWNAVAAKELLSLIDWIKHAVIKEDKIILPLDYDYKKELSTLDPKRILELLGVPHKVVTKEFIVIDGDWADAVKVSLGIYSAQEMKELNLEINNALEFINTLSEIKIRDKDGLYIGTRMGRPEKGKLRKLTRSPQGLFPVADEGGRLRCFQSALEAGKVTADFKIYYCPQCGIETIYSRCHKCDSLTEHKLSCPQCGLIDKPCEHNPKSHKKMEINIRDYFDAALKKLGFRNYPDLIKGVRGTSNKEHIPENLAKVILRAKHGVYVNKDGTTRFDMTEMACTHFKPFEIGTSVEKLKELGYGRDIYGKELIRDDQILEIKCQDIILPSCPETSEEGADESLFKVANFLDELLISFYGVDSFYNLKNKRDIVGHLVIGLSPHTAAGIVARVIGFSKTQGFIAHPFIHSIMRRDCVHPKTKFLFFDSRDNLIYENIGNYVETLISLGCKTKKIDIAGTLAIYPNEEYYTYGVDPETKKLVKRKIKYFIKGPIDNSWVKIKTATKRELLMTLNHDFMCLDKEDKISFKKAKEITIGDKVLVMEKGSYYNNKLRTMDLLKEFMNNLPNELKSKFRIVGCKNFLKKIKNLDNIVGKKDWNDWFDNVPLNELEILINKKIIKYSKLPLNLGLRYWFSDQVFKRILSLDENLLSLLGYYTAEGYCRENKTTRQVSFRICNKKLSKRVVSLIEESFGISPSITENNTKITISHSFIYYLFKFIFNVGVNAKLKQVPRFIYSLNDALVISYLSSYIDSDASVLPDRRAIVLYSTSRSLLDDLALLISRFRVVGRYSSIKEKLPGKTLIERYTEFGLLPKKFGLTHLVFNDKDAFILANRLKLNHEAKVRNLVKLISLNVQKRELKLNKKSLPLNSIGDTFVDYVKTVEIIKERNHSYCVEVEWNKKEERSVIWGEQLINTRCDGDEAGIMLLMDALLNFSPKLLSDHRGATQDEPLVLTSLLIPAEVDDMIFNMDIAWKYPLAFYEACSEYKYPFDVEIEVVRKRLGKPEQYEGYGFTHPNTDFNAGVLCSSYKIIPTMEEKVDKQMIVAEKLRASDQNDVARLIIDRHFLRDIKGNLRKFSLQVFRCVHCNEKYRRPPLKGICTKCNGKIIFTISQGSIVKYLEPTLKLSRKYELPSYMMQSIELLQQRIDSVFGKEQETQEGLNKWFG